jgi:hypothetical protein
MCLELARNFSQISNPKHQDALTQLARALVAQEAAAESSGSSEKSILKKSA